MLTALREWSQKRRLRTMLKDPRSTRGFRSTGQLEKGIGADRSTTERLWFSFRCSPMHTFCPNSVVAPHKVSP